MLLHKRLDQSEHRANLEAAICQLCIKWFQLTVPHVLS